MTRDELHEMARKVLERRAAWREATISRQMEADGCPIDPIRNPDGSWAEGYWQRPDDTEPGEERP